jgi:hypothetical protein
MSIAHNSMDESPVSSDASREEMAWEKREEDMIHKWRNDSLKRSVYHGKKGKRMKKYYILFSLPNCILPLCLTPLEGHLVPMVKTLLLIFMGVLSGTATFFNFGKKYSDHLEYENRFDEFVNHIDVTLAKPKKFRPPCDVYLSETQLTYSRLCTMAPD